MGAWSDLSLLGEADYLPHLSPLGVLGLWLLTYGPGEETGWRGFALPHLQKNRSAATYANPGCVVSRLASARVFLPRHLC